MSYIDYRATDSEIVLYWDKPCTAGPDALYTVKLNGADYVTVDRTDAQISGLKPSTAYELKVFLKGDISTEIAAITCTTCACRKYIDVTKAPYNAVGDAKTVNTKALQRAIDDCGAGEGVLFPKGIYLTGALKLHSDMEIYVCRDAVIQGSENPADYLPKIHSRFEGYEMECFQSLLNAGELNYKEGPNCKNIVIRGEGAILGGGANLAKAICRLETERLKDYIASLGDKIKEFEKPETLASRARGRLINLSNCENVWIHGLKLGNAASWNVHFIYSRNVVTDACTFVSQGIWNGDGWDPDSSEDASIFNCMFYTEDDSVAIKSGKNPEGNVINRPTRNIRIFDCETAFGHGMCMGSEMSGGIDGVKIWDTKVGPTWSGIEIKATRKRGGYVRNIDVKDTVASHIQMHSVGYNDDGIGAEEPPKFSDCRFERMHLLGRFLDNNGSHNEWHDCPSIDLQGFEEKDYEIENIFLKDIVMENAAPDFAGSVLMRYCKNVTMENVTSIPRDLEKYSERG